MGKRYLMPISVLLYTTTCLSVVYLLLHPPMLNFIFSETLYVYSILLFLLSIIFELIIIYKGRLLTPSLFLLMIFVSFPLLGSLGFKRIFETYSSFEGRQLPSFAFPTFVWSFGTFCFFGGVLLSYFLLARLKFNYIALWNRKRMLLLLILSLLLSTLVTIISLYKIGYIPLIRGDHLNERLNYGKIIGRFILRFDLWVVVGLLSSMLFVLKKNKKRYIYLFLTIISALGTAVYGQRMQLVIILFILGLMYFKFTKVKKSQVLLIGISFYLILYILMLQTRHRAGDNLSDISYLPSIETVIINAYPEWRYYSIVVNEAKSSSNYLGWQILSGPFIIFIPRPIFTFLGSDKNACIREYSAVYYYGKEFNMPYGIRITPIGEAFAAFGIGGVFFYMLFYGIFFGVFEKIYIALRKPDARLFIICYLLSLMMFLPMSTINNLFGPLAGTGPFVFAYYIFGTRKYELEESKIE